MSVDARSLTLAGYGNASVVLHLSGWLIGHHFGYDRCSNGANNRSVCIVTDDRSIVIFNGRCTITDHCGSGKYFCRPVRWQLHHFTDWRRWRVNHGWFLRPRQHDTEFLDHACADRTLFNGLGAMTMGYSNSSIQVSAPQTSSLSATGNASISTNGQTISLGANAAAVSISGT